MNITIGHGKQVHAAYYYADGRFMMSYCGAEKCSTGKRWRSGVRKTSQEVTCKKCISVASSQLTSVAADLATTAPNAIDLQLLDLLKQADGA